MFTKSNTLLPYIDSNNFEYRIEYKNILIIFYKTDDTDKIIDILEKYSQIRYLSIWSSKEMSVKRYKILEYFKNIFGELVLHVKINEKLKNEINNSSTVKVRISLSNFYNESINDLDFYINFNLYT